MSSTRVAYFYDESVGDYYYGQGHPMKPQRVKMAHQLIVNYELYRYLHVYRPHKASEAEILQFHLPEYVDELKSATTSEAGIFKEHGDCPLFEN
jgi:histone deacetylase 1/2